MLTVIRVTDWIAIALFLAAVVLCGWLGTKGYWQCWLVGAGLAVACGLLVWNRLKGDLR